MPPRHLAANLTPAEEITVSNKRVACDGGGTLGHPLVYLEMGEDDHVSCTYCDRRFVLDSHSHDGHAYADPAARPPEAH